MLLCRCATILHGFLRNRIINTCIKMLDDLTKICPHSRIAILGLSTIGIFVILFPFLRLIHSIYAYFFRGGKNICKTFGKCAVITGATDGIGKAMAFELARKGCDLVLISRSDGKLKDCKSELLTKHPNIRVDTIAVDFSNFDSSARDRVANELKSKDVGVLVNNVGVSYPFTKYFNELDDGNVESLISLNVNSTTWMTRIVLPGMLERKRGAIVNIGSAAGEGVSPLLAQYGAAKSYVSMFSRALNAELREKNVHVQCQIPLFVATKLAKIRKTSLFVPSPAGYARSAVAAIGFEPVTSPYWSHALQLGLLGLLPEWLSTRIVFSMHLAIRRKGMKKESKSI